MRLSRALSPERVELHLTSTEREPVLREMLAVVARSVDLTDREAILHDVVEREVLSSTAVDRGVAIPHASSGAVDGVVAALGISPRGLDYGAPDGHPVQVVILVLAEAASTPAYLSVLARAARIFGDPEVTRHVVEAATAEDAIDLIHQRELV